MHTSASHISPCQYTACSGPGLAYQHALAHLQHGISDFERFSALRNSNPHQPVTFALHLCPALSSLDTAQQQNWLQAVQQEATLLTRHLPTTKVAGHTHISGCTQALPTELLVRLPALLMELPTLHNQPPRTQSIKLSARHTDWKLLCQLREAGYNQLRLHSDALECPQAALHLQTLCEAVRTLHYSRLELFLQPVTGQPSDEHQLQLRNLLRLQPERITLLSAPESAAARFQQLLQETGYQPLGLYSHVLPDDDLLDAQASPHQLDSPLQLGFGCAAYSQLGRLCYRNTSKLANYLQAAVEHRLPPAHGVHLDARQQLHHSLWCQLEQLGQLLLTPLALALGISKAELTEHLNPWQQQGLLAFDTTRLQLLQQNPEQAQKLLNSLLSETTDPAVRLSDAGSFDPGQVI